jgi:UDP-N-acetylmuramate--alanine ligase
VAFSCGIDPADIEYGLNSFTGAHRRCEFVGKLNGAELFDDYGHHPTEIQTTLNGIRSRGYERVFCVFQPHTYSRTKGFLSELCNSFGAVDKVIFSDIYAARETETLGMSASLLATMVGEKGVYCGGMEDIAEYLKKEVREGDGVVIMGAGDIYKIFTVLGFDYRA